MKNIAILFTILLIAGSAAVSHTGVQNAVVRERMDSMADMAENLKVLGAMARGTQPFDTKTAQLAALSVSKLAGQVPTQFRAKETDPKSEAKDEIWDEFEDFSAMAVHLESLADGLATSIDHVDDLGPALSTLGTACKSCHGKYRQ